MSAADWLFHGGAIHAGAPGQAATTGALAVTGNRIAALGEEAIALRGPRPAENGRQPGCELIALVVQELTEKGGARCGPAGWKRSVMGYWPSSSRSWCWN